MGQIKKIPTIIGLLVLLAGTVAGIYLTNAATSFFSKASGDCRPINVQVTNVTHQSADISFTTSAPCISSVDIDSRLIFDVRQLTADDISSKTHYFQLDNLKENTSYSFNIISGGSNYSQASSLFKTATLPPGQIPASNLAWGRVLTPDQKPASGAIVYLTVPGGYPLSAIVTTQGNWSISLANSLDIAKKSWFTPPVNSYEDFVIFYPDHDPTQITGNTSRNNPVPDIVIGSTSLAPAPSQPAGGQNSYQDQSTPIPQYQLQIVSPQENEVVSTSTPQFFGTAPASSPLRLTLQPSSISTQPINSTSTGSWSWTPSLTLDNGNYTLTIQTSTTSSTRHFTINNSTGNPAFSASNSANLTTPTSSPTNTPFPSPTDAPNLTSAPTPTTPPTPTSTPTIKPRTVQPSTQSGMPTTGNTAPTFWLSLIGISSLIVGFLFIL